MECSHRGAVCLRLWSLHRLCPLRPVMPFWRKHKEGSFSSIRNQCVVLSYVSLCCVIVSRMSGMSTDAAAASDQAIDAHRAQIERAREIAGCVSLAPDGTIRFDF